MLGLHVWAEKCSDCQNQYVMYVHSKLGCMRCMIECTPIKGMYLIVLAVDSLSLLTLFMHGASVSFMWNGSP